MQDNTGFIVQILCNSQIRYCRNFTKVKYLMHTNVTLLGVVTAPYLLISLLDNPTSDASKRGFVSTKRAICTSREAAR